MNQAAGVGASQATAASLAVTCNQGAPYQVALQDINDAMSVKAAPLFDWSSSKQIGSSGAESETRVLTLSFWSLRDISQQSLNTKRGEPR